MVATPNGHRRTPSEAMQDPTRPSRLMQFLLERWERRGEQTYRVMDPIAFRGGAYSSEVGFHCFRPRPHDSGAYAGISTKKQVTCHRGRTPGRLPGIS